jgi:hypothetical protein
VKNFLTLQFSSTWHPSVKDFAELDHVFMIVSSRHLRAKCRGLHPHYNDFAQTR